MNSLTKYFSWVYTTIRWDGQVVTTPILKGIYNRAGRYTSSISGVTTHNLKGIYN